jgi:hypothetical protein
MRDELPDYLIEDHRTYPLRPWRDRLRSLVVVDVPSELDHCRLKRLSVLPECFDIIALVGDYVLLSCEAGFVPVDEGVLFVEPGRQFLGGRQCHAVNVADGDAFPPLVR